MNEKNNSVAAMLTVIAWLILIGGLIAGIVLGRAPIIKNTSISIAFSFQAALVFWIPSFISGTLFFGFAEIINLLEAIKNK